jgi:outer membrane protein OmpA-like peptidoglycan-associated protein
VKENTMKKPAPEQEMEREQPARKRRWVLVLVALALLGAVLVALSSGHHATAKTLRLGGTDLEPGWWGQITTSTSQPAQPSGNATVVASIPSDVLFAEGSAQLEAAAAQALTDLAATLRDTSGSITVDGHTDLRGDEASNLSLGQSRAEAVAMTLIALGVPADRITTRSYGEAQPTCQQTNADGSDNADCRARCRRVVVTYQAIQPQPA